jgi:hypothetical protein
MLLKKVETITVPAGWVVVMRTSDNIVRTVFTQPTEQAAIENVTKAALEKALDWWTEQVPSKKFREVTLSDGRKTYWPL